MTSAWVRVEDALPDEGEAVIVYRKDSGIAYREMYCDNGIWYDQNSVVNAGYDDPPTHWATKQKLPPPPEVTQ